MQCRPQYGRLLLVPGALLCLYLCARVQAMQTGEEDNVSVDGPTYRRNVTGRNCSKVAVRMPSETGAIRVLNEKRVGISSIPFDGAGWAASSGEVEIVSTHFCADLEMVELEIVRVGLHQNADPFDIRVKVGLEMLERQSLVNEETSVKIRFGAPKRAEYQRGLQPVFIAWGSAESLVRSTHPWRLMQLKWKKGSQPFNWQGKY